MARIAQSHPEDLEALSFLALAIMGTTARCPALFGEGGDDQHQHALVGSEAQKTAAAILEKVLAQDPTIRGHSTT